MANIKYDINIAKEIFKNSGCKLLETKYINCKTKMKYRCSCGNISEISLPNFKKGQRCKECYLQRKKFKYDYVYNYFKNNNCELLSKKYNHSKEKLKYRCSCGNISTIEFRNFKQGKRCKKCSPTRAKITNKNNHNGMLYVKTNEFLSARKRTCLKKYGVENPLQSPVVKKKLQQTNLNKYGYEYVFSSPVIKQKIKNTVKNKYGCEYLHQSPIVRKKFKQTLLKKHGVPSLAYLSNCSSKESQKLFDKIYNKIGQEYKEKTYFASLNNEFTIKYKDKYFKYDFVNSKFKKAIEYNGFNFHPKPNQKDNEIGWCAFHPKKTAKEAKQYEKIKYEGLQKRGYQILTVWDYELHNNFNNLVKKCLTFLLS